MSAKLKKPRMHAAATIDLGTSSTNLEKEKRKALSDAKKELGITAYLKKKFSAQKTASSTTTPPENPPANKGKNI